MPSLHSWNDSQVSALSPNASFQACPVASPDSIASVSGKSAAYILLFLLSVVGNSLIIMIIYKEKDLRSTTNTLIANMSVSDLLASVFFMPIAILEIHNGHRAWPIGGMVGNILCKLVYFIHDVSVAVSVESLTFISIDRFCGIVQPLRRKPFVGRVKKVVIFIWLNSFLFHSPFLYAFQLTYFEGNSYCVVIWPIADPNLMNKIYFLTLITIFFAMPLCVIVALQSLIIRKFHTQSEPRGLSGAARLRRHRRNRKVVIMILAVIVVFFGCWSPIIVYSFIVLFSHQSCPVSELFRFIATLIVESNKSWNFFIYFIFNETYRRALGNIFRCGRKTKDETASHAQPEQGLNVPRDLLVCQEESSFYYHRD